MKQKAVWVTIQPFFIIMENKIDFTKYDYKILIDKSGSTDQRDCPNNLSRWQQEKEWAKVIAQKCETYDSDGIDVILFDNDITVYTGVTSAKVDEIFRKENPGGSTNLADALKTALQPFLNRRKEASGGFFGIGKRPFTVDFSIKVKPMIIIVLTDGEPNDKMAVVEVIKKTTECIQGRDEVGITFVQVGKNAEASKFLQKLDDNLTSEGTKFDIVDCKDYSAMNNCSIEDVFIGALTD